MAVIYADGIVFHMTSGHGGLHLSADRNTKVHPLLRKDTPWYEEDCEWAIVAVTFPDLFTAYERPMAEKTVRNIWPDAWEMIHGCVLAEGESWAKDRRAFDQRHRNDFVVASAILSGEHAGMTEVVAVVNSDRKPGNHRRRFLVASEEYAGRGRFGFVIDHARHVEYDGPSSFVGWESRGVGHDRPPHFERRESNRRSTRDPAASRLFDAADCGARRKTGDDGEGLEPGAAPIGSSYLPSGARGLPHLRALGRTRHDCSQNGDE
ncbi:DUF7007 domain-containing protein [Agrobacterium bohemicum]|uniref:DUF7007 domain-containing protein n=1 Tax=Agrobacterium bohemicum TaxID=2052828 RepID=UPI000A9CEB23